MPGVTWLLQPDQIFAPKIREAAAQLKPMGARSGGDFVAVAIHHSVPGAHVPLPVWGTSPCGHVLQLPRAGPACSGA